jgi:hypothetical protein
VLGFRRSAMFRGPLSQARDDLSSRLRTINCAMLSMIVPGRRYRLDKNAFSSTPPAAEILLTSPLRVVNRGDPPSGDEA